MRYSTILGIESSCDDTAAAIWHNGKILANIAAGQKVHEQYGGVVPELASRAHQSNIIPTIRQTLINANIALNNIDAIAYTQGPGLMGSLLVGANTAKGISLALNKPMIGIDHLQAHVAALYIENPKPEFPMLVLLVSGGHTKLVRVDDYMKMKTIGTTLDDAAGEAFDKAAKLLNLPYPGGPEIDRLAKLGNPMEYTFPHAKVPGLDMSFSGIKTSLLYFLRKSAEEDPDFAEKNKANICASFQHHMVGYLIEKTRKAIAEVKPKTLGLAGGVSANGLLRSAIATLANENRINGFIPAFEYCTDNAAMIAVAGHYLLETGATTPLNAVPFSRNSH
jgi:N6-L-threonylcarbamoyladenine synthase